MYMLEDVLPGYLTLKMEKNPKKLKFGCLLNF